MASAMDYPSQDMEQYFNAMTIEDANKPISDQEIMDISKTIGIDWTDIGITLGYSYTVLEMLEDMFLKQPVRRNFVMIKQWYNKLTECGYNARKLLAKYFEKAERIDLADTLDVDYLTTDIPDMINSLVQQITFDRDLSRSTGSFLLQQLTVNINMHSAYIPHKTEELGTKLGDPQRMHADEISLEQDILLKGTGNSIKDETSCKEKTGRVTEIDKLVDLLSLKPFFPAKLTLQNLRAIRRGKDIVTESDIPWLLLSKIVMLNYNAREEDLYTFYQGKTKSSSRKSDDSDDDLFEDNTASSKLNPADLFYVTFLCCDMMFKLELVSKLFTCRLAIPFIYKSHNEELVLTKGGLRKILINKCIDEKAFQIDALNHDAKRVSFVRLGRPSLSKSRLINEIINDQYHPTFFNRYCPLGASTRKVAEGIVESSWYIPAGKQNDSFSELIMFLNLRGNCMDYQKELEIVCKLSHILMVHTDVQELLNQDVQSTLVTIHKTNLHVIYALESCKTQTTQPKEVLKEYKRSMDNYKQQMKFFNLKSISSDIAKDLRKIISETLIGLERLPLADLIDQLQISDETKIPLCSNGLQKAQEMMCKLSAEKSKKQ